MDRDDALDYRVLYEKVLTEIKRLRGFQDVAEDLECNLENTLDERDRLKAENDRLRWALEEIVQAAEPEEPWAQVWRLIPIHLVEQAEAALRGGDKP